MSESGADLYRSWIGQLWNGPESVDELRAAAAGILADDFVGHWPGRDVHGPDELAQLIAETKTMFTDLTFEIEIDPVVDGDTVAARWVGSGTTSDGTVSRFFGHDILRMRGGRFGEYWVATVQL
ncbi:ester cyclase [Citricoccus sp. GCM10030269]|uniref:ester cyclase n=1 Tax=Citricoccus sp. GCM10030269 TaxID=3273388 RepID=UPI003616EFE4